MGQEVIQKALSEFATPLYVFDEAAFLQAVKRVRLALPSNVGLCYAMKANPFLVGYASTVTDRIEVCSTGEMRVCQSVGVPMDKVVVSGVHKDPNLMRELMESAAYVRRYTVESVRQFEMLERTARELGIRIPLLIRLSSGNQFGLDKEAVRQLLIRAHDNDSVYPFGIQYSSGTQKSSAKRMRRELQKLDGFMEDVQRELSIELCELEYGAGLAVAYFAADAQAAQRDEEEQLLGLSEALESLRFEGKIIVELGRALAASCGTYATRVVDTKRTNSFNYAIVDGGMHQLVYFGHAMSMQQPPWSVLPCRKQDEGDAWSIYGSLCTGSDVLAKQIPCGDLQVNDVVLFHDAGAYCVTEGISLFLSRDLPRVIIADQQGALTQVRNRVETWTLNAPTKG